MEIAVPLVLGASAMMALVIALVVRHRRPDAPASAIFWWLMVAVSGWCGTSAFHALAPTLPDKLAWATMQYVFIASVPVLWLLFTAEYATTAWLSTRRARLAIWIIPAATVVMVATNQWHRGVWPEVLLGADGTTVYEHGWWFWIAASFNYVALASGTVLLIGALRRSPPPLQSQALAFISAAAVPWAGNLAYLSGTTEGFDPTPLAFTASGVLFSWALYRNHLFDLLPIARDMVIDSLADAVIVVDPARRVLDVNTAGRELMPAGSEIIGSRIDTMLPALAGTPLVDSGEPSSLTLTRAGEHVHYEVRVMPVRARRRNSAAWVVLMRDVTVQRRAAAERDSFQRRVNEQQRRESLSVMAGGLAHDFNNLLAGIVGNADLLALQLPPRSEMGSSVSAILLGAQRAADLVAKMLAYAGERHGSTLHVDLDVLTRELLDLLGASAARHCAIEHTGSAAIIHADPTQIRQVAMNLIINAAESVDERGGRITVTTGSGRLTARQLGEMTFGQDAPPGDFAFLEVVDNGVGMDADTQRRIFMPFFTTKQSGHGLGLAAVQGIVLGHRGALRVDSRPGSGSRFCVWLPLARAREHVADAAPAASQKAG